MTAPVGTLRVDWFNTGVFGSGPYDSISPTLRTDNLVRKRGRSADFSGETVGELSFVLNNTDNAFTAERNWCNNPSFEIDTFGWDTLAVAGLTAAATSLTRVTDHAPASIGTHAGEAVLTATSNSGVVWRIPYRVQNGITYAFRIPMKSMSGTLNVRAGVASEGTVANIGSTSSNITASWADYTGTFTATADRDDVLIFVRTNTAAAATLRIDAIQLNPGGTANTYLEAPTKGQLIDGRPVHFYATYSGIDYPLFYGAIERITPAPHDLKVAVTCYDQLRKLAETDIIVNSGANALSAREMRLAVLGEFERGNRNLVVNPSFETNTTGWAITVDPSGGSTFTRTTSDFFSGTACGSFAATADGATVTYATRLTPIFVNGETYRASVYLRCTSGTQAWKIGIADPVGAVSLRPVTVTTTWQRFSITCLANGTPAAIGAVTLVLVATGANTVHVDAAAITRGQPLYPYDDTGTGRWPNFMGTGGFDGGATTGWTKAWTNLITNPSFETNTSGWSTAASAFLAAGDVLTRDAASGQFGTASGAVADGGAAVANKGVEFAITGTFVAGTPYTASIWLRQNAGTGQQFSIGIGSNGTPADKTETLVTATLSFTQYSVTWTPLSNRTDARLFVRVTGSGGPDFHVDGAIVAGMGTYTPYPFATTGPAAGGAPATSIDTSATSPKYGSRSLTAVLPATTGAGIVYDFYQVGSYFQSGQPFTLSLWLNVAAGTFPYKVGLSANKGDGTFDEVTTTGTVTAGVWKQVTLSWTPAADRSALGPAGGGGGVWLTIYQTNATARTIFVDGGRLIPGSSADEYEMPQWLVPQAAESDMLNAGASATGTALAALTTLNGVTLSRHWIRPTMTAPYYAYVLEDRDTFAAKAVAETINETIAEIADLEIDRTTVINTVPASWVGGADVYSDGDSVRDRGPRIAAPINGSTLFPDRTVPDIVGPALIDRYGLGVARPRIRRTNSYAAQFARDLSDLLDLSVDRFLVRHMPVTILTDTLTVSKGGLDWTTENVTETFPF